MEKRLGTALGEGLNNGVRIPVLGFGTWKLAAGMQARRAVGWALEAGYRLIDTAAYYGNEEDVGLAVRESGLAREEVFVTTKLWNSDQDRAQRAFGDSNRRLGLDYVDLYLIHWPQPGTRLKAWKELEKIYGEGSARAIGVSNFTAAHLEEFSPFLYQKELLDYCRRRKIAVEAYSPLTRGEKLRHPAIRGVAERHGKTPAQVMLRWSMQKGCIPLPKSAGRNRIFENAGVFGFKLSARDVEQLDSLDESLHVCWDPSDLG